MCFLCFDINMCFLCFDMNVCFLCFDIKVCFICFDMKVCFLFRAGGRRGTQAHRAAPRHPDYKFRSTQIMGFYVTIFVLREALKGLLCRRGAWDTSRVSLRSRSGLDYRIVFEIWPRLYYILPRNERVLCRRGAWATSPPSSTSTPWSRSAARSSLPAHLFAEAIRAI